MRDRIRNGGNLVAILIGIFVAGPYLTGCEELERRLAAQCEDAEVQYQQALEKEQKKAKLAAEKKLPKREKRPAHFGLTLSNDLLTNLANIAVEPALKGVLELASTVSVGGQKVDLETKGDVVDLSLDAHKACDHCFRLGIDLGGAITADIPGTGKQQANLDGGANLVVPLFLDKGDKKSAAVKLDLDQLAKIGASKVNARIAGISDDWERRLRGPLSDLLLKTLANNLEPVTLLEFNGPSFGIDGFELTPVVLQSDDSHGSVFAGFATNIEALNEESIPGVTAVTDLAEDQNIALSFQPQLILHALSLLIGGKGKKSVARRYTSDGDASETGNFHVTLESFGVGAEATTGTTTMRDAGMPDGGFSSADAASMSGDPATMPSGETPVGLGFMVHQFGSGAFCFSAGARMDGGVAIRDDIVDVAIHDVEFTSDSTASEIVDLANWTTSQFIQESRNLVTKSFDGENLKVPGTKMNLGPVGIGLKPNTLVLRGKSNLD